MCAGVQLSTDYSGTLQKNPCGCLAAAELCQVISKGSENLTATRNHQSPECRTVLMMHQGPFRPGCIHGDIGERCDAAIWESLRPRLASLQGAAAKNKRKSQDGAGAAHGLAFVREAFERVRAQDMEGLAAFCCRHRRMCPVLASNSSGGGSPSPSPGAAGARNGSGSTAAAAKPSIAGFGSASTLRRVMMWAPSASQMALQLSIKAWSADSGPVLLRNLGLAPASAGGPSKARFACSRCFSCLSSSFRFAAARRFLAASKSLIAVLKDDCKVSRCFFAAAFSSFWALMSAWPAQDRKLVLSPIRCGKDCSSLKSLHGPTRCKAVRSPLVVTLSPSASLSAENSAGLSARKSAKVFWLSATILRKYCSKAPTPVT